MEPGYTQPSLGNLSTSWAEPMYGGTIVSSAPPSFYYDGVTGGAGGRPQNQYYVSVLEGMPSVKEGWVRGVAGEKVEYQSMVGKVTIRVPAGGGTVIIPMYV